MGYKYQPWLTVDDDGLDCEHDFDKVQELDKSDLPKYAGDVTDKYCSRCGVKQTFKQRMASTMAPKRD
jgi:hypothetical protein